MEWGWRVRLFGRWEQDEPRMKGSFREGAASDKGTADWYLGEGHFSSLSLTSLGVLVRARGRVDYSLPVT